MKNGTVYGVIALVAAVASPAFAQEPSPLDPAVQLAVCRDMRAVYISDSEMLQTLLRQASVKFSALQAERDALAAKLKEAEAKRSTAE